MCHGIQQIVAHRFAMEILSRNDSRFGVVIGKAAPEVVLPAMPIRIVYTRVEQDYSLEAKDGKHFFRMEIPKTYTPGWTFGSAWDAYNLRESFERLRNPEDAWQWLQRCWTLQVQAETVQSRQPVNVARASGLAIDSPPPPPERSIGMVPNVWGTNSGLQIDLSSVGVHAELSSLSEQIWTVSEETFGWLQGFPQGLSICRDRYLSREETEEIFSAPGSRVPNSLEWHRAQAVLARRRAARAPGIKRENKN